MSLTPEAGRVRGLVHTVGFYGSDEEFVRTFAPFCREGRDSGGPTLVRVDDHKQDLLRSALDDPGHIVFLPYGDEYQHPPGALASVLKLLHQPPDNAATPLRVLGELPVATGLARDAWIRYESAVNQQLADFPVHALCACDVRTTPASVQAEMRRTHHGTVTAAEAYPNPEFVAPSGCWPRFDVRDRLESRPPTLELTNPAPSTVRHELVRLTEDAQLDETESQSFLLAVSEVLANAIKHGREPILVRSWATSGRLLVSVRDHGEGPQTPLVGLVPPESAVPEGGLGLWIAHQLCPEIALSPSSEGFTVRLAAGGRPSLGPQGEAF